MNVRYATMSKILVIFSTLGLVTVITKIIAFAPNSIYANMTGNDRLWLC